MIFSQDIQVRPFIKDGVVKGIEIDFDLPFPDGKPPFRVRRKSPFKASKKLTQERAEKQSLEWAEVLRHKLWNQGERPKTRKQLRAEKAALDALPKPVPMPTLNVFAPRWVKGALEANQPSERTVEIAERDLRLHILPRFGSRLMDSFGLEDFQRLKGELRIQPNGKARSVSNLNAILALFYRIVRDAALWEVIPKHPPKIEYLKKPRAQFEIYEEEQYTALLQVAKAHSWQLYLIVLIAGDAGLRVGEVLGLRWSDVDWRSNELHIRQQDTGKKTKKPKGEKTRDVPISPALKEALQAHRHLGVRVLVRDDGKPIRRAQVAEWLYTAEEQAELPLKSAHKLRHTFATRFLQRGGNLRDAQALLGHTDLATTQLYLHANPREAAKVISTFGSGER